MSDGILIAILSLLGTLGGSWLGVRQSNKLVTYRIDRLEEAVKKHNNLVERVAVQEGDIKRAHKRIDSLEAMNRKERDCEH